MGNPLIDLVVAIVALCGAIGAVGMLRSGLYDRIGEGGIGRPRGQRPDPRPGSPAAAAERELELRQMLQARSERRVRQGLAPLDLDAELAQIGAQPPADWPAGAAGAEAADAGIKRHDPELVEELRQLADARNARRIRRGEQPLDVPAEVRRALAELDG